MSFWEWLTTTTSGSVAIGVVVGSVVGFTLAIRWAKARGML